PATGRRPGRRLPGGITRSRRKRNDETGHLRPVPPEPIGFQDRRRPGPVAGERKSRQPTDAAAGRSRPAAADVVRNELREEREVTKPCAEELTASSELADDALTDAILQGLPRRARGD